MRKFGAFILARMIAAHIRIAQSALHSHQKLLAFIKKSIKLNPKMNSTHQIAKELAERQRIMTLLNFEKRLWEHGCQFLVGVDEAGRGPLAGPVVAAAVVFPPDVFIPGVNDSKKLSPARREQLYESIVQQALSFGIAWCDHHTIDRINILQATFCAMRQAIAKLNIFPDHVLVDGRPIPDLDIPQTAITGGDAKCFSIAAASIIAKVTRDRIMLEYDRQFPQYGFAQHKGYPTKKHIQAIIEHGYCPIHRVTFSIKSLKLYAQNQHKTQG